MWVKLVLADSITMAFWLNSYYLSFFFFFWQGFTSVSQLSVHLKLYYFSYWLNSSKTRHTWKGKIVKEDKWLYSILNASFTNLAAAKSSPKDCNVTSVISCISELLNICKSKKKSNKRKPNNLKPNTTDFLLYGFLFVCSVAFF